MGNGGARPDFGKGAKQEDMEMGEVSQHKDKISGVGFGLSSKKRPLLLTLGWSRAAMRSVRFYSIPVPVGR
jgi:hypothetical protein